MAEAEEEKGIEKEEGSGSNGGYCGHDSSIDIPILPVEHVDDRNTVESSTVHTPNSNDTVTNPVHSPNLPCEESREKVSTISRIGKSLFKRYNIYIVIRY